MTVTVVVGRAFKVAPEQVFDAWLDPAKASRFLFTETNQYVGSATIDARVGGEFHLLVHRLGREMAHTGRYVEVDRPRRLVFKLDVVTTVSVDIVPDGAGCELTVTHEGLLPEHEVPVVRGWTTALALLEGIL